MTERRRSQRACTLRWTSSFLVGEQLGPEAFKKRKNAGNLARYVCRLHCGGGEVTNLGTTYVVVSILLVMRPRVRWSQRHMSRLYGDGSAHPPKTPSRMTWPNPGCAAKSPRPMFGPLVGPRPLLIEVQQATFNHHPSPMTDESFPATQQTNCNQLAF